jgi:hypothetical protein
MVEIHRQYGENLRTIWQKLRTICEKSKENLAKFKGNMAKVKDNIAKILRQYMAKMLGKYMTIFLITPLFFEKHR